MNTPSPLQEITSELTGEFGSRPIARQRVLDWMQTDDIECMGAIHSVITEHYDRVQPALQFDEYHSFVLTYFQRCLLEDPQSEWAATRYGAGHAFIGWFVWAWRRPERRTSTIPELKEWLAALYLAGDADVRTALVQATLEHLFENPEVVEYFSDWREHPVLSTAYDEAMEWVEHGGRSPFWLWFDV
jgi:hypothetical protein